MSVTMTWFGDDVKVKMNATSNKSVLQTAIGIQGQAIELCQVDSGNLRGSIQIKFKGDKGIEKIESPNSGQYKEGTEISNPDEPMTAHVGSACVYAAAQEFGLASAGKSAYTFHPYLRPAVDIVSGKTLEIFEVNGRNEFREYFKEKS